MIEEVRRFSVAAPSWALGTGGTRFGRFPGGGEPRAIEEKLDDVATLNALTGANRTVSLHVPWDEPDDVPALRQYAESLGLGFDAINSNTFQDNPSTTGDGAVTYKFGSMAAADAGAREAAVEHNLHVIELGEQLGSSALSIWIGDGTNHPGQASFRLQFDRVADCLRRIHDALPDGLAALHRAQALRARVLLDRRLGLGLVAAARAGGRAAGPVPRRSRSPSPEHEHRAGRLATRDDRPARRLPLQRLQVRRRRPHRRLDPAVRALPRDARAAGARGRIDAAARLHDRPEQQPQGPDRGSRPGHGRDPAHARARSLRRPLGARGGAGGGRPGAGRRDPPRRVPRRRQAARGGSSPAERRGARSPHGVPAQWLPRGGCRRARLGARRDRVW